jgi:CRISPR-associated endonuclease/helicase Cas3
MYQSYWGKSDKANPNFHHLFAYHSLDVVAVADAWWQASANLRRCFAQATGLPEAQTRAWLLFFIALHDIGKLDIRFQSKVKSLAEKIYSEPLPQNGIKNYFHGDRGYAWFVADSEQLKIKSKSRRWLQNGLAQVAGHHGSIPVKAELDYFPNAQDQQARLAWITRVEQLFLTPVGLTLNNIPRSSPPVLLAGFCSICDWLGSNEHYFPYQNQAIELDDYLLEKQKVAHQVLTDFGLLAQAKNNTGMASLYPQLSAHNIQTLIEQLAVQPCLVLMEANTGSGKTEAALALASRLLSANLAESITFALPSQATANAMFDRLESVIGRLFDDSPHLILAHGKSQFNPHFTQIIQQQAQKQNIQQQEEANAQCSEWLASSRKRAFLGACAVTTVDQVLLSAIKSVRHHFVRQFGIGKSVLIVDEVHAYDAYMYGLLTAVISQQKQAGGSVILLSATLASQQKQDLCAAWGVEATGLDNRYPLILQVTENKLNSFTLDHEIPPSTVKIERWSSSDLRLDEAQLARIVAEVRRGQRCGIVCNLVDDAQTIAQKLSQYNQIPVDLFHSRYRFCDRMSIEQTVIEKYGKDAPATGRVLVATQVIEQSLDLDFDWLISFLCPIDLLFQRMGRLQRHPKPVRVLPAVCTVILPEKVEFLDEKSKPYGLHQLIYQNSRALWRSQQLLQQHDEIVFPQAYRDWIERVYQPAAWPNEPQALTKFHADYVEKQKGKQFAASELSKINHFFQDTESNAALLTRESELNLSVIPVQLVEGKRYFIDGQAVPRIKKDYYQLESLAQNSIAVPASWDRFLPQKQQDVYFLPMEKTPWGWVYQHGEVQLTYSPEKGLEKSTFGIMPDA